MLAKGLSMVCRAISLCKFCLIFVTMFAMVAIGFAHRAAQPSLSPELVAYVAAGGSLSDICGTAGDEGNAPLIDCEACRISDHLGMLGSGCHTVATSTPKVFIFGFVAKRIAESQGLDPARLVRAPPQA
ncbi:hypothetical protein [Roseovarius aestuarii]|nr:hypothetical protein [Roseovarius aestuarii]